MPGKNSSAAWFADRACAQTARTFSHSSYLAAGLATSFVVLVVARFLQGASAALVAPSALAVLYREGAARTRALSIFQAATAGGATAGIVLGGLLTSYIG